VNLVFTATNDQGVPVNLTGATFSTEINGPNSIGPITFGNSQHTANANQVNFTGQFTLALANTDTANLGEGINKEIITEVTIAGATTYFRGVSILNVYPSAPNP
jgi:hypothetical protein